MMDYQAALIYKTAGQDARLKFHQVLDLNFQETTAHGDHLVSLQRGRGICMELLQGTGEKRGWGAALPCLAASPSPSRVGQFAEPLSSLLQLLIHPLHSTGSGHWFRRQLVTHCFAR